MQSSPAFAPQLRTNRSSVHDLTSPVARPQRVPGDVEGISFAEPYPAVRGITRDVPVKGLPSENEEIAGDYPSRLKQLVGAQPVASSIVAAAAGAIAMSILRAWSKKKVSRVRSRWIAR